jgi:arginyl-tRNA synthetase
VREALARLHAITDADLTIPIEYPPNRALGDLGTPVAFDLARRLRKAPRAIAQELAGALGPIPGVARIDAAPNGYLNVFLDRPAFLLARLGPGGHAAAAAGAAREDDRRAHRYQSEQRRRTSATFGTRRSATRWCAC